MFLIVGLGNPGSQYTLNRHNIGFMSVDYFLKSIGQNPNESAYRHEHKALTQKVKIKNQHKEIDLLIAKPQTYMNKSGESVLALMNFYKIERSQLLVIQDDIDQIFLSMKIQFNRGHGGQNGIRNISEVFSAADYHRLKLGVGRPIHPGFDIGDYVLSNFTKEELIPLKSFLEKSAAAIESFIFDGPAKAASNYNGQ